MEWEEEQIPAVQSFRSRKRPLKARKRYDHNESQTNAKDCATEGLTSVELSALKEAQGLRERIRASGLNVSVDDKKGTDPNTKEDDINDTTDGVVGGLTSHFSAEQSGQVVDKRMRNFIEEGLRKKFGDRYVHDGHSKEKEGNSEDVFEIPEHLKVSERSVYDPSEGMPAAGLEELEVPLTVKHVKLKTDAKPEQPKKKSKPKNSWLSNTNGEVAVSGNFSSNFAHHRNEWIETHLGSQPPMHHVDMTGHSNATERGNDKHNGKREFEASGAKRYSQASDSVFAERFRKRWRR